MTKSLFGFPLQYDDVIERFMNFSTVDNRNELGRVPIADKYKDSNILLIIKF